MTTPTHSEDPAEGADTATTDDAGRTPHPDQPAEGADTADAETGLDPENRITGA
ncbi:hypothetical protein [Klenkia taihuensis]|uniref:Uncharacterized protein n=1 Tax=Klenkia taihuensis TaxID=1225127 RepID=A0A1I1IB06_9ACTN|nr:hypothetical protein [Klenkia taihuensis]GHE08741.1 hypothetical protein GCM10011381_10400 [Klenkia taihuensis]SFC33245.1 hypothetical protein SAMN05661030_0696 [Klenkia taihuensis]